MPERFLPFLNPLLATLSAVFSAMTAAVLAVLPDVIDGESLVIMDNEKMRLICVVGALGGGVLSALIFTPPKSTGRGFAAKVLTSSLAGILFTPGVVHWLKWTPNVDLLLALSALVSMVAVAVLRVAIPMFERMAAKKLDRLSE